MAHAAGMAASAVPPHVSHERSTRIERSRFPPADRLYDIASCNRGGMPGACSTYFSSRPLTRSRRARHVSSIVAVETLIFCRTNCFPLKTLEGSLAAIMRAILMIGPRPENSNPAVGGEFRGEKDASRLP